MEVILVKGLNGKGELVKEIAGDCQSCLNSSHTETRRQGLVTEHKKRAFPKWADNQRWSELEQLL
jgi:hypothetical protein